VCVWGVEVVALRVVLPCKLCSGRRFVRGYSAGLDSFAAVLCTRRGICFIGTSLNTYLEAAYRDGRCVLERVGSTTLLCLVERGVPPCKL
jgi:hypothetical protein